MAALKARIMQPILLFMLSWGVAFADIQDDFQAANEDYLAGNYELAISGFKDFLANYPDSRYSDHATYNLGKCYEEQKQYEQAIQTYAQLVERYPKSQIAPIALHTTVYILKKLERHDEANDAWMELLDSYPNSPQAIKERRRMGTDPPQPHPPTPSEDGPTPS